MSTVFLVDDDPGVLRSLTRVLREGGFDVQAFASAEAFLDRPDAISRGCLVLDVMLPGLDGPALQRRLSVAGHAMPIVFLTGIGDIPMSVRAIKEGAADFLTKPVASATLLAAVRAAIAQDGVIHQAQSDIADLAQRFERLTAREREVLAAVIEGKLNKQIAADLGVVEQTVKYHRARIMARMQAHSVAELMQMVAKLGVTSTAFSRQAAPARSDQDRTSR
jgi:FixJ family two-component response regulator